MEDKTNKIDNELGIDREDIPNYDRKFANDIFDVIDSFIDKENISEGFNIKRALDYEFNRHCLASETKVSNNNHIYYDFKTIEEYKDFTDAIASYCSNPEISFVSSLGDKEAVISSFQRFFEEDEYLKITPQCGFSFSNRALTLYLNSTDYKISENYNGKVINVLIQIGDEIHNLYPISMDDFLQKLNNVIKKHCVNVQPIKINPEAKRRRELYNTALTKAKEIYGDVIIPYIVNRLNYELDELSKSIGLKLVADVAKVQSHRINKGHIFIPRAFLNNSLLFFFIGIGNVNPMPRHHYCPSCHTFHWGEKSLAEKCECCNASYKEDGYDLQFELLLNDFKTNKVEFAYLTTENIHFPYIPELRYVRMPNMELAKALNITQQEINNNEMSIKTIYRIIKCLIFPKDNSEQSYYSSHYKNHSIFEHLPFIGIQDLGSELLHVAINDYYSDIKTFDDLVKALCLIHGTGVIEANSNYLNGHSINGAITSRDDLYRYLIDNQISNDDALLICRSTRLCGQDRISPLIISKLKDAGESDNFISYLKRIQSLFYKGHIVATLRLELLLSKIYLDDPLRYYRAFYMVNKRWVVQINDDYDFIKELPLVKYRTFEEIYLGAIDLEERGYKPRELINEIKAICNQDANDKKI